MTNYSKAKKAVFAISSHGKDFYTAMTRVAIASVRLYNPEMHLVVTCDRETNHAVRDAHDPLLDEVDEWVVVDTPPGDDGFRNRFIKTNLRAIIDGAFLFLDSDIVVRGDLSEIFALDTDIAGGRNHSREIFNLQISDWDKATLTEMKWPFRSDVYINGGVLYYNDTMRARLFGAEWHMRWKQSYHILGYYRDQPSLNSALFETKPRLSILPDHFNAQFKFNPAVAIDAVIWHYYSSLVKTPVTPFEFLVKDLLNGKNLDKKYITDLIECAHPWKRIPLLGSHIISGMMKRGFFKNWETALLSGNFWRYIVRISRDKIVWKIKHFIADIQH